MDITPDTKIGDLLEAFPPLEDVLIGLSPTFAKLKNPVLRRTVAKVASIRQAAQVGGVPLGRMINALREAAGQKPADVAADGMPAAAARPKWAADAQIAGTLDARPMLERGEHPMPEVMAALGRLEAGRVYLLITPFVPAPLIDLAAKKGFEAWSGTEGAEVVKTFFRRKTANGSGTDSA
jgi:uncharacterized protein (DUF2249 family)